MSTDNKNKTRGLRRYKPQEVATIFKMFVDEEPRKELEKYAKSINRTYYQIKERYKYELNKGKKSEMYQYFEKKNNKSQKKKKEKNKNKGKREHAIVETNESSINMLASEMASRVLEGSAIIQTRNAVLLVPGKKISVDGINIKWK